MSARGVACAVAALAAPAGAARAATPPNGWDAARDPAAAERYALHVRVREILANARIVPRDSGRLRARVLLQQAGAEQSPDVRLRFDLGEIYADLDDNLRAIEVLQPALDLEPDHPAATAAFIALANGSTPSSIARRTSAASTSASSRV